MGKKAFMKTMEIVIVVVLTTIFMILAVPSANTPEPVNRHFLINLMHDQDFRDFASSDSNCHNSSSSYPANLMDRYIPKEFEYELCIGIKAANLPEKDIYVDTLYFSGTIDDTTQKVITLYYWLRS